MSVNDIDLRELHFQLKKQEATLEKIRTNQESRTNQIDKVLDNQSKMFSQLSDDFSDSKTIKKELDLLKQEMMMVKVRGSYFLGIFATISALVGFLIPWLFKKFS